MAANDPNSPRQKMINLMYLVFIAMLALNVSNEVLDGFELVEESLLRSVKASSDKNNLVFNDLETYHTANSKKTEEFFAKAEQVKQTSDTLFNYIQDLKVRIVRKGDGKDGNPEKLEHPDDLNASFEVMFERGKNEAKNLKNKVDSYRTYVSSLVTDSIKRHIIESNLSTEPSKKAKENNQTWEESMFSNMPMAAAVTLLTKMQNDVRDAEGEILSELLRNIDVGDFRVNKIEALVIPQSQVVMRGGSYSADIVLSAIDSTKRPRIFVNGKDLPEGANGKYIVGTGSTGTFPVQGYIEMARGDGSTGRYDFSSQYYVQEQSATIESTLMNVLYAGYKNPINIAVPGVTSQNVKATMTNGSLTENGNGWIAVPSKIGTDAVFSVVAKTADGRTQEVAKKTFRVRALPDPSPYIEYKDAGGNPVRFQKSGRLAKSALQNVNELKAAIDDGILNIEFQVVSFSMRAFDSMGSSILIASDGPRFSQRQKEMISSLQRGKALYVTEVIAKGPDGRERKISLLEIILN